VSEHDNQQTELLALPGWGTPFPEEKPRVDAEVPVHAGLPTGAAVAAASAVGEEAAADFTHEDRRPLDRRRRKARGIDSLIIAPFAFGIVQLTEGVTVAAVLLVLALEMTYFFVLETINGQTIGKKMASLRVVHTDGSAASASKIAARTILRPIDYTLIGIITVLASGPRRQRLGDLAAGTIVREDNRSFTRAPESPLIVVYPLLWIAAAVAAMLMLKPVDPVLAQRNDHPYMAKIDRICEKRVRQSTALAGSGQLSMTSVRTLMRQETRKIQKLPAPPAEVRADVKEVVGQHKKVNLVLDRMARDMDRAPDPNVVAQQQGAMVLGVTEAASARFKALGLPYCAK
jgi:hypothetical protein